MPLIYVTYEDKDKSQPINSPLSQWRDIDANEVKDAINALVGHVDTLSTGDVTPVVVAIIDESSAVITHNFDRSPVLRVVDGSGKEVSVASEDVDSDTTTINFGEDFTGAAICI